MQLDLLILIALIYGGLLFLVAFAAEQRAKAGKTAWLRSPLIYTLSLSVYCTGWTFYGAVGFAARSGLEYITIYLGPTLVFVGWWWLLRKLVRVGRAQRATSIADLLSSRYGKSNGIAVLVTILAVVGTTPYIALQLQSVNLSLEVFAGDAQGASSSLTGFWTAVGLAVFTVFFGTRNLDANERHHGVVMAIAVEAVVKLFALIAVGVFVVWGMAGGFGPMLEKIDASPISTWEVEGGRWITLTMLSGIAVICLPRMFQVLVVENSDERHLATASWAFPLYLLAISLFVVPIAVMGLDTMPAGSNPDKFVLTLPLSQGQNTLAVLAFLGGFSSATSMVIVASIALSTMLSNHVVMPIWLSFKTGGASLSGDVRRVVLYSRRLAIGAVLALGYGYYEISGGSAALAQIGLISFAGVAQVFPALIGGLFWRGATRRGAASGLIAGFLIWVYTLLLPSFGPDAVFSADMLASGPFGIAGLHPEALFGLTGLDPLVHAMLWSMVINTGLFLGVSLATFPSPMERLQGAEFVNVFENASAPRIWSGGRAEAEDLLVMAQRILGTKDATSLFSRTARLQEKPGYLPDPTPEFLAELERKLAGSVGAGTAHAMIAQVHGGASISVADLMAVADETAQIMEYSTQLEAKSGELQMTAQELRRANEKLTQLAIQKDAFLSQISHELRTPMTSIRAFSEILLAGELAPVEMERYARIIQDESIRLTRLLDDLLDLSVLEHGQVTLDAQEERLGDVLDRAVAAASAAGAERNLHVVRDAAGEDVVLKTDTGRLAQVFINLVSNAAKYCDAERPMLTIISRATDTAIEVDFVDNGAGIPADSHSVIFEKFARLDNDKAANSTGGAGLGLAISREIMERLGGEIAYLADQKGAAFRVTLPISGSVLRPVTNAL